jgi:hypothetical protein
MDILISQHCVLISVKLHVSLKKNITSFILLLRWQTSVEHFLKF